MEFIAYGVGTFVRPLVVEMKLVGFGGFAP